MQLTLKTKMTSNEDCKGLANSCEVLQFTTRDAGCKLRTSDELYNPLSGTRALCEHPALVGGRHRMT